MIHRIYVSPTGKLRQNWAPAYTMTYEGEVLGESSQPIYDGARALLERGAHPALDKVVVRWEGKDHDSFLPVPLGFAGGLTVSEGDKGMVRKEWVPFGGSLRPGGTAEE